MEVIASGLISDTKVTETYKITVNGKDLTASGNNAYGVVAIKPNNLIAEADRPIDYALPDLGSILVSVRHEAAANNNDPLPTGTKVYFDILVRLDRMVTILPIVASRASRCMQR